MHSRLRCGSSGMKRGRLSGDLHADEHGSPVRREGVPGSVSTVVPRGTVPLARRISVPVLFCGLPACERWDLQSVLGVMRVTAQEDRSPIIQQATALYLSLRTSLGLLPLHPALAQRLNATNGSHSFIYFVRIRS